MCGAPKGRRPPRARGGGGLSGAAPPPLDGPASATQVKAIPAAISSAQGLLWAFDSLYVVTNGGGRGGGGRPNGLYRVKASEPGGELDDVQQMATVSGRGGPGPARRR